MGRVCINTAHVYTNTPHVYSSSYSCVFFYTSDTFLFSKLIECCLQGVDRFLSTPYLHLSGIYLHLSERFCDRLRAKYSLFGGAFSLFIVFFQQKILHFRLSATCCGMLAVHVHRECENEKFLIGYKYSTFSPFFQIPIRLFDVLKPYFLTIFSRFLPSYGQITLFFPPNTARNTTIFSQNRPKKV